MKKPNVPAHRRWFSLAAAVVLATIGPVPTAHAFVAAAGRALSEVTDWATPVFSIPRGEPRTNPTDPVPLDPCARFPIASSRAKLPKSAPTNKAPRPGVEPIEPAGLTGEPVPIPTGCKPGLDCKFSCDSSGDHFCPEAPLLREELPRVFLEPFSPALFQTDPSLPQEFQDVPPCNPFIGWIQEAYREPNRLIEPCSVLRTASGDGAPKWYCPERVVTRIEAAQFLLRLSRHPATPGPPRDSPPCRGVFCDTKSESSCRAAEALFQAGIDEGCSFEPIGNLRMFCPREPFRRKDAARWMSRWLGLARNRPCAPPPEARAFADVGFDHVECADIEAFARFVDTLPVDNAVSCFGDLDAIASDCASSCPDACKPRFEPLSCGLELGSMWGDGRWDGDPGYAETRRQAGMDWERILIDPSIFDAVVFAATDPCRLAAADIRKDDLATPKCTTYDFTFLAACETGLDCKKWRCKSPSILAQIEGALDESLKVLVTISEENIQGDQGSKNSAASADCSAARSNEEVNEKLLSDTCGTGDRYAANWTVYSSEVVSRLLEEDRIRAAVDSAEPRLYFECHNEPSGSVTQNPGAHAPTSLRRYGWPENAIWGDRAAKATRACVNAVHDAFDAHGITAEPRILAGALPARDQFLVGYTRYFEILNSMLASGQMKPIEGISFHKANTDEALAFAKSSVAAWPSLSGLSLHHTENNKTTLDNMDEIGVAVQFAAEIMANARDGMATMMIHKLFQYTEESCCHATSGDGLGDLAFGLVQVDRGLTECYPPSDGNLTKRKSFHMLTLVQQAVRGGVLFRRESPGGTMLLNQRPEGRTLLLMVNADGWPKSLDLDFSACPGARPFLFGVGTDGKYYESQPYSAYQPCTPANVPAKSVLVVEWVGNKSCLRLCP